MEKGLFVHSSVDVGRYGLESKVHQCHCHSPIVMFNFSKARLQLFFCGLGLKEWNEKCINLEIIGRLCQGLKIMAFIGIQSNIMK